MALGNSFEATPPLCMTLSPLVKSMEVFGLFQATRASMVVPSDVLQTQMSESKAKTYARLALCTRIYSMFMVLLSWANFSRYSVSFWAGPMAASSSLYVMRAAWLLWLLQCSLNRSVLLLSSEKRGHIRRFHTLWYEFSYRDPPWMPVVATVADCQKWRRYAVFACVAAWTFVAISETYVVCIVFIHANSSVDYGGLFTNPFYPSALSQSFFLLVNVMPSSSAFFPAWYVFCHASVLKDQFSKLTSQLKDAVKIAGNGFPSSLEAIRRRHLQLCHLLAILDKDFKLLIMSYYLTTIPLACVDVYSLVHGDLKWFSTFWTVLWNLILVKNLTLITFTCARVNSAAHAPLELLHEVRVENATKAQVAQLNLFISRLSTSSIGFTVLGLVTVTKEVLLTIGGLYMTYVFLVLQFKVN